MKKVVHYIGADLSKKTIDLAYRASNSHIQIENQMPGFKKLMSWLKELKLDRSQVFIVMEHTGHYSKLLEKFLHAKEIQFCKVAALEIIRSSGMTRGKNDKVDARRIALFAEERASRLKPNKKPDERLERLKILRTTRDNFVRQRSGIKNTIKEYLNIGMTKKDLPLKSQYAVMTALNKEIERLDQEMENIINENASLLKNYNLLQSIKGVGKVVATAMLVKTENFTKFANARKFACYSGTAPFEHSSGSSIKGRTRVSHMADKEMKTLLELSARSAAQFNPEIRNYYQRRVAEGKSKQSTLNMVRNKLIARMFAVIKRQEPYSIEFGAAA